jgi:hypothetical protein
MNTDNSNCHALVVLASRSDCQGRWVHSRVLATSEYVLEGDLGCRAFILN